MRAKINNIDLIDIDEKFAFALKQEIIKATKDKMYFTKDYPKLTILLEALNGTFFNATRVVHFFNNAD